MLTYCVIGGNGTISSEFIKNNIINLSDDKYLLVDISESLSPLLSSYKNINYFQIDVTNPNCYTELINYLDINDLKIDRILFAVGINLQNNFFSSTIHEFNKTILTNFNSLFISLKVLYNYLNEFCSIVVISSQNGLVGHEDRIDYGPSKAALIQIVKNLSIDFEMYGNKDVKINCISPGYLYTSKSEEFFQSVKGKKLIKRSPYNEIATIKDIVSTISFLFNDDSNSIRGQNIIVDYGYTII